MNVKEMTLGRLVFELTLKEGANSSEMVEELNRREELYTRGTSSWPLMRTGGQPAPNPGSLFIQAHAGPVSPFSCYVCGGNDGDHCVAVENFRKLYQEEAETSKRLAECCATAGRKIVALQDDLKACRDDFDAENIPGLLSLLAKAREERDHAQKENINLRNVLERTQTELRFTQGALHKAQKGS